MKQHHNSLFYLFLFSNKTNYKFLIKYQIIDLIIRRELDYDVSKDRRRVYIFKSSSNDAKCLSELDKRILSHLNQRSRVEYHDLLKRLRSLKLKRVQIIIEDQLRIKLFINQTFLERIIGTKQLTPNIQSIKNEVSKQIRDIGKKCRKRKRDYQKIFDESQEYLSNTIALTTIGNHMIEEKFSNRSLFNLHTLYLKQVKKISEIEAEELTYLLDYLLKSINPVKKSTLGLEGFSFTNISPTDF